MEPLDEERELPFRELFPEDETRAFFRPEFQLPTRRIAIWSIGISVLLAIALIVSFVNEKKRTKSRPKFGKMQFYVQQNTVKPTRQCIFL